MFKYNSIVFIGGRGFDGKVDYTVTIEVKDNKYRYRIEGFTHKSGYSGGTFGLITTNSDYPSYVDNGSDSGRKDTWSDLNKI